MLENCASAEGVELRKFSPLHFRIMGANMVDYWPSTSRAWLVGSSHKAKQMSPQEAYALSIHAELLPENAIDHMKNI